MQPSENRFRRWLFPDPPRRIPYSRAWNIAARTAHIFFTGVLVGGHVFEVPAAQLHRWLYLSIGTGAALVFLEAFPHARWFYQGRGLAVLLKLLLLCLIPWCWDQRVAILIVVTILASVGSHMPARFRYYSLVHGRVIQDPRKGQQQATFSPGSAESAGSRHMRPPGSAADAD